MVIRVKMKRSYVHTNDDKTQIYYSPAGSIFPVTETVAKQLVNLGVATIVEDEETKKVRTKLKKAIKKVAGKNKQLKTE